MQSDKYGDIADICRGLTMVMPGQVLELRPLPSSSSGPSVREMVLGSEGRLGVITSAWVNVHRIPEVRELQAYFFPTYEAGLKACEAIVSSDAAVMMARVSDAVETQYIMANGKKSGKLSSYVNKAIQKLMKDAQRRAKAKERKANKDAELLKNTTPEDLRKRFETFLSDRCKGRDTTKLRFVVE